MFPMMRPGVGDRRSAPTHKLAPEPLTAERANKTLVSRPRAGVFFGAPGSASRLDALAAAKPNIFALLALNGPGRHHFSAIFDAVVTTPTPRVASIIFI